MNLDKMDGTYCAPGNSRFSVKTPRVVARDAVLTIVGAREKCGIVKPCRVLPSKVPTAIAGAGQQKWRDPVVAREVSVPWKGLTHGGDKVRQYE